MNMGMRPEDVMADVRLYLEAYWGPLPGSHIDPDVAVRLCDLVNWTAKLTGDYSMKAAAFVAAAQMPLVESGWDFDECGNAVFYVQGPDGIPASAHDPHGEIERALIDAGRTDIVFAEWPYGWDGRRRQRYALDLLLGRSKRRQRILRRLNAFEAT